MASLRPPERPSGPAVKVPQRFLNWGDPHWQRLRDDPDWASTFNAELDEWCDQGNLVMPGEWRTPDRRRLAELGVRRPRRLRGPWPAGSTG